MLISDLKKISKNAPKKDNIKKLISKKFKIKRKIFWGSNFFRGSFLKNSFRSKNQLKGNVQRDLRRV